MVTMATTSLATWSIHRRHFVTRHFSSAAISSNCQWNEWRSQCADHLNADQTLNNALNESKVTNEAKRNEIKLYEEAPGDKTVKTEHFSSPPSTCKRVLTTLQVFFFFSILISIVV